MADPNAGDRACSPSDRRHEDEQLLAALRATNFKGKAYDDLTARLMEYATRVIWRLVRDDDIWAELERIERPRTPPTYWGEHDKESLVSDSVTDGYLDFHRSVLVADRWDSSRASLSTLLVRYCLGRFADHYQAWQRRSVARLGKEAQRDPDFRGPQQAPSAERVALAKHALSELSSEQLAHGVGYSHKEIGQMLGITDRAVEGRLRRHRTKTPEIGRG